jgi:hypothetical protein
VGRAGGVAFRVLQATVLQCRSAAVHELRQMHLSPVLPPMPLWPSPACRPPATSIHPPSHLHVCLPGFLSATLLPCRLSGYIFDEKVAIARTYLEPQVRMPGGTGVTVRTVGAAVARAGSTFQS